MCVRVGGGGGGGGVECGLVFVVEDMGERENKRSDHLFEFRTGIIHRLGEMKGAICWLNGIVLYECQFLLENAPQSLM